MSGFLTDALFISKPRGQRKLYDKYSDDSLWIRKVWPLRIMISRMKNTEWPDLGYETEEDRNSVFDGFTFEDVIYFYKRYERWVALSMKK